MIVVADADTPPPKAGPKEPWETPRVVESAIRGNTAYYSEATDPGAQQVPS